MKDLTISDCIIFFNSLDLKSKVELLRDLTVVLNDHVPVHDNKSNSNNEEEFFELFGAWADDDEMTEENIINRTISEREISLD